MDELSRDFNFLGIVIIPLIDIESIKEIRNSLLKNNFNVNLNLIQTYKTFKIAEGMRLDPNNPVFLLKGKKLK